MPTYRVILMPCFHIVSGDFESAVKEAKEYTVKSGLRIREPQGILAVDQKKLEEAEWIVGQVKEVDLDGGQGSPS